MNGDGECEDGAYDADSERAVDAAPPCAVSAVIADQDEENEAKHKLANANEVEEFGVAEKRHVRRGWAVDDHLSRGE